MTNQLHLPNAQGQLTAYQLVGKVPVKPKAGVKFNRIAYSAAHVVSDPLAANDPWLDCSVDWDATIAYRRHLWSLGLGVAEAMDTAQRGMGLDWPTSLLLIQKSIEASKDMAGAFLASGCGTDHLNLESVKTVDEVIAGYEFQMEAIEKLGGQLIVMASRALARVAKSPADYERVYDRILSQAKQPVLLHWLGDMFDPALTGYWGSGNTDEALEQIKGKVWEKKVSKLELPDYQKNYKVISNKLVGGQPLIHVFSDTNLENGFVKAEENLEDVFFAKLNELV
jgi:hypothetical protein